MVMNEGRVKLLLTEDLSPHKICLLFMVDLYRTGKVHDSRLRPFLSTLIRFLENDTFYDDDGELVVIPTLSTVCNALEKAIVGSSQDSKVKKDSQMIQRQLLKSLWDIQSVEKLDLYIAYFSKHLVGPANIYSNAEGTRMISSTSFVGTFTRKIVTAFRVLTFDEIFLLFESFIDYREPTRSLYSSLCGHLVTNDKNGTFQIDKLSKQAGFNNANYDVINDENEKQDSILFGLLSSKLSERIGSGVTTSTNKMDKDHDRLLPLPKHDLQNLLDKQINLLEMYGTETPKILKDIMRLMTSPHSNTCSIQNINFNNLPSYYYIKYLENLKESNYNGAFDALHQYFDYMVSSNSKYFYHFALISRASLHQYFGEDKKAIDAIEEAISVARENKDTTTLTFILSWLFDFMKNKPELWQSQSFYNNDDETQLLSFLIKKSQSVSSSLYAMSFNFECLQIMNNGGPMSKYLESSLKATYISINDTISSFVKSVEMCATMWSRIGVPCLSDVYNETAIGSTSRKYDKIAIEIRATFLQFLRGETDSAINKLNKMRGQIKKDHSFYNSIQVRGLIMLIKLNLMKGRFFVSKRIISVLVCNDIKDIELRNELHLLRVEIESALGNDTLAMSLISEKLNKPNVNVYFSIKLNILKCKILNKSGTPSKALTLIIQQIQQAKALGFIAIVSEALVILTTTLNNLGYSQDANKILKQVMPSILSTEHIEIISNAYYQYARAFFSMYKNDSTEISFFNKNLKYLNLSITGFKKSSNLVMLTKCFMLESEVAQLKGDKSLIKHAKTSIEKLDIRSKEEFDYGFVIKR